MRHLNKLVGISLIALTFFSIAITSTSAATYTYSLVVGKGAYTKYQCVFSNTTSGLFRTGSTFSYIVADVNMTWGYDVSYASDTHRIEGAFFIFYINGTFDEFASSGDMDLPMGFLITPTSGAWWNLLKSYAENLSVYNRVTIGADMVDVTWFWQHGGINETYAGSIDKDTGVVVGFTDSSLNVTSHQTQITDLRIVETNIPNVNTAAQPTQPISTLFLVGVVGICATVGLVAGLVVGRKRVA
ncbi:MAG: hypothetical protein WED05_06270 [Candidatus Atabeyarchaeum deiterrae]